MFLTGSNVGKIFNLGIDIYGAIIILIVFNILFFGVVLRVANNEANRMLLLLCSGSDQNRRTIDDVASATVGTAESL